MKSDVQWDNRSYLITRYKRLLERMHRAKNNSFNVLEMEQKSHQIMQFSQTMQ